MSKDKATRVVKIPDSWRLVNTKRASTLAIPIVVDWPELQLTNRQRLENAAARAAGDPEPHPDRSLFVVELPLGAPGADGTAGQEG